MATYKDRDWEKWCIQMSVLKQLLLRFTFSFYYIYIVLKKKYNAGFPSLSLKGHVLITELLT